MIKFMSWFAVAGLLISFNSSGISIEKEVSVKTEKGTLAGTLTQPQNNTSKVVALLIAGSGATDRNGNNPSMQNNSLKYLSQALASHGIASLRYDKRGVAASANAGVSEAELTFEHYINDAKSWISYLDEMNQFGSIVVIGHSEGSLIGIVAANQSAANKYVSLAGAGQPIDLIMREQLKAQPPIVLQQAEPLLDSFVKGKLVENVPEFLVALFRPSVQPYLISWFKYNPQNEIAKLTIPVLIVQGTTDLQVGVKQAKLLDQSASNSSLSIIEGMNHVLKIAPNDRMKNYQTYNQPELPISEDMVVSIISFIKK